jgi:beta-lactam-binding protein with PASTA domain
MPNLVGQTLGVATQMVQSAGMKVGTVNVHTATTPGATPADTSASGGEGASPSSLVLSQQPPAGQKITAGSSVDFEVSR